MSLFRFLLVVTSLSDRHVMLALRVRPSRGQPRQRDAGTRDDPARERPMIWLVIATIWLASSAIMAVCCLVAEEEDPYDP